MGIISSFKTAAKGLFNLPRDTTNKNSYKSGVAVYEYGQRNSYNNLGVLETMKYPIATSFLYAPVFGIPRKVDLYAVRSLSKSHWVRMFVNVIIKTVINTDWDVVPVDESKEVSNVKIFEDVKSFFNTPSTNGEDISYFNEVLIHDYLEVGEMMLGLVYNESLYESKSFNLVKNGFEILDKSVKGVEKYEIKKGLPEPFNCIIKTPKNEIISKGITKKAGLIDVRVIDPASMTVKIDKFGDLPLNEPAFFQYLWMNPNLATPTPFFKREVVWVKNNPTSYDVYGQSHLISVMMVLETLIASVRDNKLLFENGAMPDGILSYLTDNKDDAVKLANLLKSKIKNNPHKTLVVNEDHKYSSFRLSNQDLEWLNGMKFFKDLIGAVFNVPPDELGFTENSNRATAFGQNKVFIRNSIFPVLKKLEMVWNKVIRTFYPDGVEPEVMFKFFYDDFDLKKAQRELDWGDVDRKIKTINEVRLADGDEEVEWGDKPFEPVNPLSADSLKGNDYSDDKDDMGDKRNKDFLVDFDYDFKDEKFDKKKVLSDRPENISSPLEEYLNKVFSFISKEVRIILNKGLSLSETISELQSLEGNIGMVNLDGIVREVNKLYDLGIDNVEELTNMNIGAFVNKEVMTDVFAQQVMYGYTLPSGKKWKGFKGVSEDLTKKMVNSLIEGVNDGKSMNSIADELVGISDMSKYHSLLIARTETSRILHGVELTSISKAGIQVKKKWMAHHDSRTGEDSKRLDKQVVSFDENFIDPKTGAQFFAPPHRPNDRCTMEYIYQGYSKSGVFSRFLKASNLKPGQRWVTINGRHVLIGGDGKPVNPRDREIYGTKSEGDNYKGESLNIKEVRDFSNKLKEIVKSENFSIKEHVMKGGNAKSSDIFKGLLEKAGMNSEQRFRIGGPVVYNVFKDDILKLSKDFKTRFDNTTSYADRTASMGTSYLLANLETYGLSESKDAKNNTNFLGDFIKDLRDYTNNDVAQINNVLKYTGNKARVKTEGMKAARLKKTEAEIKKATTSHSFKGINYSISEGVVRTSVFKSRDEFVKNVNEALATIPNSVKKELTKFGTDITFVNRSEIKTLTNFRGINSAAGFYSPKTKKVYIFAAKKDYGSKTILKDSAAESLKSKGYDDKFINSLKEKTGKDFFKNTIVHEVGHAVALNNHTIYTSEKSKRQDSTGNTYDYVKTTSERTYNSIQDKYDSFISASSNSEEGSNRRNELSNISKYSMTNSHEDFAEHFAYYNIHKKFIDTELTNNNSKVFGYGQLQRFKFMKKLGESEV